MSKSLKRTLSASTITSDSNRKRIKASEYGSACFSKFMGTHVDHFKAPLHTVAAGLYRCGEDQSSEVDEQKLTDYDCTFLRDLPGVAKKGDVADSIHHDFDLGIMEVTLNDKLYRIRMSYFPLLGDVQVTDLRSKEWDGSLASIQ